MSDGTDAKRYLRLTVDVVVEVLDLKGLQVAALAKIHSPLAELNDIERQEQVHAVNTDETGAAALQWLIDPDHILALIEHVPQIEPREAMLGVEPSDGILDDEEHAHGPEFEAGPDDHLL